MSERQQLLYMQTRMIRIASERWHISLASVAALFTKYDVLAYIQTGFGIFHVEGDDAVFADITDYLERRGISYGN